MPKGVFKMSKYCRFCEKLIETHNEDEHFATTEYDCVEEESMVEAAHKKQKEELTK